MLKTHCDVCEALTHTRGHMFANKLEPNDRLRNVSAKIEFFGPSKNSNAHNSTIDLCDACFDRWLNGLATFHKETK